MKKLTARQFQQSVADLATELRRTIESECSGFPADPAVVQARRAQALEDYEFFAHTYFPHYCTAAPALLHLWLYEMLPRLIADRQGHKVVIAAPRGEAKSTLIALIFVLWCVAGARKHCIPIFADAFDQASVLLEGLKAELLVNPRLSGDFPEMCGEGRLWQEGIIITANDIKIQAFGSGKRMRGLRHGPHRPDLAILDDLENDENVRSSTQRDKLESWIRRTVLKLGPANDSMDIIYIGTVLHYDSVLARTLKNPLWEGRCFKAMLEMPQRMDLWARFEELIRNAGKPAAVLYYQERQAEMDAGAVLSWPAERSLLTLMLIRVRDGHASFDSEFQNDPLSDEGSPFARVIQFWVNELPEWIYFGAVDPSLGKANKSRDPCALLVGGFNRTTGILDVIEADIAWWPPDLLIQKIIERQRTYACQAWAIEAVQFQEFFRTTLVERSAAAGVPVPALPVTPHTDKDLRIASLQPHCANGLIRFHPHLNDLINQVRHWPRADHDDGPDCLEMLWKLATAGAGQGNMHSVVKRNLFNWLKGAW